MTDYKPGDRVRVEFEAIYIGVSDGWIELNNGDVNIFEDAVDNLTITRIKPPVPTAFGGVVELEGEFRLVFDGCTWSGHKHVDTGVEERYLDSTDLAKLNFSVIREGI